MNETVLVGEEALSNRLKDSYPYRGDGTGRSEPVTIRGIKIRSDSDVSDTDSSSSKDGNSKRKSYFSQPQGTLEYRVMARDTLDSIALSFDSSPSQLMRLNHRLSRMIFPGQVLYVPDPDAEVPLSPVLHSPTSPTAMDAIEPPRKLDVPTVAMKPRDVPTVSQAPPTTKKGRTGTGRSFSLRRSFTRDHSDQPSSKSRPPLQKAQSLPQPGHAVRQKSVEWDSEDSRQYLKLDVKYITDGEGVVSGTMLVTPNAIMFDPNVSDPLVKDRGAGSYGVMTNMDMVLGASMYHDISAMNVKTQSGCDDKDKPCCPVYVPDKGTIPEEASNSSKEGKNSVILAQDIRKRLTGCSNYSPEKSNDNHSKDTSQESPEGEEQPVDESERTEGGDVKGDDAAPDNVTKLKTSNSENMQEPKENEKDDDEAHDEGFVGDSQCDSQREQSDREEEVVCPMSMGYERLQSPTENDQGTKRISDSADDDELSSKAAKRIDNGSEEESGDTVEGSEGKEGAEEMGMSRMESQDSEKSLEPVEREMDERLQEIEMLLNSSDDKIDDTCQEEEPGASPSDVAPGANDSKSVEGAPEKHSPENEHRTSVDDECPGKCKVPDSNEQDTKEQAEAKQNFVDFSSGLFVSDCRKCSLVPDLKECIHVKDEETLKEIKEEGEMMRQLSDDKSPDEECHQVNGESNNNAPGDAEDTTDGGIGEKPAAGVPVNKPPTRELEYNRTNFREFLPKRAKSYEDPPLYLCLRTKKPMQKTFSARQEHRFRKNKVPEYWFAIPRVKADNLYAFFLQWSPDVYGKEFSPSEVGFVVVQEPSEDEELELIEDFFQEPIHKDWEIISREEASKRRMTILECEMNLPLPELVGESTLLSSDHVRKLSKNLPPRTEGYSWVLVFSTATHGYSLHSLYRNMAQWESPILLILRDSEGHVFGALTSCALKVSDHYYGTGESFLYRFKDEELQMYRWTGENNFFMKGDLDCICIGGGEGDFGLWLDGDLYHGRSHPVKTFGNETLSAKEDFIIADMEAWGFNT